MLVERNGTLRVGLSKVPAVDVYDAIIQGRSIEDWLENFPRTMTAEDIAEAIAWVESNPEIAQAERDRSAAFDALVDQFLVDTAPA